MKIAMLARNANLYSHQRLQQAAEERGHQFDILNTTRCTVHIASHKPEVFYNGEPCIGYDAVIPRIGASITNYGLAILRQFEMRGCWPLNESVAIERSATRDAFEAAGVVALRGDWTQPDAEISRMLTQQGAAGVPLYLWYEPGGEAEQLPQVLTPDLLVEKARASARPR